MACTFPWLFPAALLLAQQPVIRVDTRLVEVNVIVRDQNNKPIEGLTQADFTLYDRGQEQKIALFSAESLHKTTKPSAPLPPGIYTNRPDQRSEAVGAITVVLLDAVNTAIQDQAYAKQQFIKFLSQIRPEDRVAIYALGDQLRILHDFTGDSKALLNTLAHFRGDPLPYAGDSDLQPSNTENEQMDKWLNDKNALIADNAIRNRVRATVGAMEAIANHIGHLPGRKNLVWITGSFPFTVGKLATESITNVNDLPDPTKTSRGGTGAASRAASGGTGTGFTTASLYGFDNNSLPGNSQPARDIFAAFEDDLFRAARALNDADIAVYPVDARGLIALPKIMTAQTNGLVKPTRLSSQSVQPVVSLTPAGMNTMDVMAENTGGRAFYNTNDLEHAIRDAIDDSDLTYTLGFYPDAAALDSGFHKLKVVVDRKHADVRYRKGYLANPASVPGEFERDALIKDALWSPLENPAISLAGRVEKAQDGLHLTVSVEPSDLVFLERDLRRTVSVEFAFALLASDERTLNTIHQTKAMDLDETQFEELRKKFIVTKTLDSYPDVAEIKVVMLDVASGRFGSLTLPVK